MSGMAESPRPHATPGQLPIAWSTHPRVRVLQTTRIGGFSAAPYDHFNLGPHVGDDPDAVRANRGRLRGWLPGEPVWLEQAHGVHVIEAGTVAERPVADAAWTATPGVVCAVMTADCLPVVLADRAGTRVAAVHAGWRGLADGVVEAAVSALDLPPAQLQAWLGPCIGPRGFVVGVEVRERFLDLAAEDVQAFLPAVQPARWLADLAALGRLRLRRCGVDRVAGGDACTWSDPAQFFSHRRDGAATGRMATLVWIAP
jgi:polyphenol oxidase